MFCSPSSGATFADEACAKVVVKGILLGCYCESDFDTWRRRGVRYMSVKNDTNAMIDDRCAAIARVKGCHGN